MSLMLIRLSKLLPLRLIRSLMNHVTYFRVLATLAIAISELKNSQKRLNTYGFYINTSHMLLRFLFLMK